MPSLVQPRRARRARRRGARRDARAHAARDGRSHRSAERRAAARAGARGSALERRIDGRSHLGAGAAPRGGARARHRHLSPRRRRPRSAPAAGDEAGPSRASPLLGAAARPAGRAGRGGVPRVAARRRIACRAELAPLLHERTDGNPLFLVAVLGYLLDSGRLRRGADEIWTLEGSLDEVAAGRSRQPAADDREADRPARARGAAAARSGEPRRARVLVDRGCRGARPRRRRRRGAVRRAGAARGSSSSPAASRRCPIASSSASAFTHSIYQQVFHQRVVAGAAGAAAPAHRRARRDGLRSRGRRDRRRSSRCTSSRRAICRAR